MPCRSWCSSQARCAQQAPADLPLAPARPSGADRRPGVGMRLSGRAPLDGEPRSSTGPSLSRGSPPQRWTAFVEESVEGPSANRTLPWTATRAESSGKWPLSRRSDKVAMSQRCGLSTIAPGLLRLQSQLQTGLRFAGTSSAYQLSTRRRGRPVTISVAAMILTKFFSEADTEPLS
jgi:hypothetical protein